MDFREVVEEEAVKEAQEEEIEWTTTETEIQDSIEIEEIMAIGEIMSTTEDNSVTILIIISKEKITTLWIFQEELIIEIEFIMTSMEIIEDSTISKETTILEEEIETLTVSIMD